MTVALGEQQIELEGFLAMARDDAHVLVLGPCRRQSSWTCICA
jgi:hypothetical protein